MRDPSRPVSLVSFRAAATSALCRFTLLWNTRHADLSKRRFCDGRCFVRLERIVRALPDAPAAPKPPAKSNADDDFARARKTLDVRCDLTFDKTPLSDVAKHLNQKLKIPVFVDERALDGVGVGTDTPITCDLKGLSLRTGLDLMLDRFGLAATIQKGSLLITTDDEADAMMQTLVIDVTDFLELEEPSVVETGFGPPEPAISARDVPTTIIWWLSWATVEAMAHGTL